MWGQRVVAITAAIAIVGSALAGCTISISSSRNSDKAASNDALCAEDGEWTTVPNVLDAAQIADLLGVTADDISGGSFGPASCYDTIPQDEIGSTNPPIVSVENRGEKCLVIGTYDAPQPGGETDKILAICPAGGNNTSQNAVNA